MRSDVVRIFVICACYGLIGLIIYAAHRDYDLMTNTDKVCALLCLILLFGSSIAAFKVKQI